MNTLAPIRVTIKDRQIEECARFINWDNAVRKVTHDTGPVVKKIVKKRPKKIYHFKYFDDKKRKKKQEPEEEEDDRPIVEITPVLPKLGGVSSFCTLPPNHDWDEEFEILTNDMCMHHNVIGNIEAYKFRNRSSQYK